MNNNEAITVGDIILRLKDLASDRKSFFNKDGDDEIFRRDYIALMKAIHLLELILQSTNSPSNDMFLRGILIHDSFLNQSVISHTLLE